MMAITAQKRKPIFFILLLLICKWIFNINLKNFNHYGYWSEF
ncbi:hypothetical protein HPSA20_0921 [Helicobacter pylori SouthAfrica20]|uniref:Uncharacterized protein n=1 Tax=Helicobacter pylori SouthAfrica20 TaxID=1352356 RepID=T1U9T2_HELPX|nr:hypothetical protein HPSA20_0921 [Helicobacter pylori SouthAfrica20]